MTAGALVFAGTVVAVRVVDGGALPRTEVTLEDGLRRVEVVLPGANGGAPAAVAGVPVLREGERWRATLVETRVGLVPRGLGEGLVRLDAVPPPYALNGLRYQAEQLPLVFFMGGDGAADIGAEATEAAVEAALAQWSGVGCASFAMDYGGRLAAGAEDDGLNVLKWEEDGWDWGAEVAGLTITRFGVVDDEVGPVSADVVFNGVDWTWVVGEGDVYASPPRLDAGSVITHELGHVTGLDHVYDRPTTTMFYAYLGGDWMATIAGDDRRGLCANYPSGAHECDVDDDCAGVDDSPRHCEELEGVRVCEEDRDAVGAACSRTSIDCADYCVFTNATATEGYCSVACAEDADCPDGFVCGDPPRLVLPDDDARLCAPGERAADTGEAGDSGAPPATATPDPGGGCGCHSGGTAALLPALAGAVVSSRRRRRGACCPSS